MFLFLGWIEHESFPRNRMSNFVFLQFCVVWLSISDPPPSLCWSMSVLLECQGFCGLPGLRSPCQSLLSAAEPLMPLARKWKKLPNNLQIDANVITSNSCCWSRNLTLLLRPPPVWNFLDSSFILSIWQRCCKQAVLYPGLGKALEKWNA